MAQSFSCRSCGAPLDYHRYMSTIQCPYCFATSSVPDELRSQEAVRVEPGVMLSFMAQAAKLRDLANLVRTGQKQQATQLYQQVYKVGPDEAARAVDRLTGGAVVVTGSGGLQPPAPPSSMPPIFSTPPTPGTVYPASLSPAPMVIRGPVTMDFPQSTAAPTSTQRLLFPTAIGISLMVCCGAGVLAALGFSLSSAGSDSAPVAVPAAVTELVLATRAASLATEQSQSATQIAGLPTFTETATDTPEPTATDDPRPGQTATAEALVQATADADLVATAKQWPVTLQDNFSSKSRRWYAGDDDNDYYSGSHTIAGGLYQWEVKAKQNVVSFITPDPYTPLTDFYAAVDITLTGPADAAAGLVFRDSSEGNSFYAFTVNQNGDYAMTGYLSGGSVAYSGSFPGLAAGVHRLAVVAQGSHFVLLIDDQVVETIDDSFLAQGDIGLVFTLDTPGDSATFEFDNVEIRSPG